MNFYGGLACDSVLCFLMQYVVSGTQGSISLGLSESIYKPARNQWTGVG